MIVIYLKGCSTIHGSLIAEHKIKKYALEDEKDEHNCIIDDTDEEVLFFDDMHYNEKNNTLNFGCIPGDFYFSPFARLKPFLYSYQRYFFFFCVFKPLIDRGVGIYKIYTDGFYADKRIPEFDELTDYLNQVDDQGQKNEGGKRLGAIVYEEKK